MDSNACTDGTGGVGLGCESVSMTSAILCTDCVNLYYVDTNACLPITALAGCLTSANNGGG
ncbi:MAG: hypothetical protein JKY09_01610 [Crocinitomicaceae bacterium]|nr:hypothetical protein [Crocinitomicaceae bacterium]